MSRKSFTVTAGGNYCSIKTDMNFNMLRLRLNPSVIVQQLSISHYLRSGSLMLTLTPPCLSTEASLCERGNPRPAPTALLLY